MDQEQPTEFLDVHYLLESESAATARALALDDWAGVRHHVARDGMSNRGGVGGAMLQGLAAAIALAIFVIAPAILRMSLGHIRAEQQAVQSVAEMVQLRLWQQAAEGVQRLLSQPARSPQLRGGICFICRRSWRAYHRFDDAIAVQNHLLESDWVNPATAHGLKLGRAMGMLHEDHLFDADRAISDLKRTGPSESASTALVEMYRDVKTGHPESAIRTFEDKLPALRTQMGHRLGDAYALVARAYDLLGRQTEAADAFRRSTLLAPLSDLCRRYPEVNKLVGRYTPSMAPPEMA